MSVVRRISAEELKGLRTETENLPFEMDAEVLGRGVTGTVYAANDPARAIKLCRRNKPYERYLRFIEATESPHVPVIYEIQHAKNGRMRVEMERLAPLDPETADWRAINAFASTCHAVADGRPVADTAEFRDSLNRMAWALGRFARMNRLGLDLQCENIMTRPDTGELVFVDPLR